MTRPPKGLGTSRWGGSFQVLGVAARRALPSLPVALCGDGADTNGVAIQSAPKSWSRSVGWLRMGFLLSLVQGRMKVMFQLSGFHCKVDLGLV